MIFMLSDIGLRLLYLGWKVSLFAVTFCFLFPASEGDVYPSFASWVIQPNVLNLAMFLFDRIVNIVYIII